MRPLKSSKLSSPERSGESLKLIMNFNSFSPLNFTLSCSGLHLLPKNLWIKILNWICLLVTVVGSVCHLTEILHYSFNLFTRHLVSTLIWDTEAVNNFICIFVIFKNRKHLKSVLKRILPLLSKKNKRCLWKLSISGCICSIVYTMNVIFMYRHITLLENEPTEALTPCLGP